MTEQSRANDYDVTGTVQVSSATAVCDAVGEVYARLYPDAPYQILRIAFGDFRRLFNGEFPGYLGCDTVYHDMQHTLDMTLAMARLIGGYETAHADRPELQLGPEGAILGIVTALFHDSGYILRADEQHRSNGAEYTRTHIARGAQLLQRYLPTIGLGHLAEPASQIIHFTGYEIPIDELGLAEERHAALGRLLGTADLIAQMADRCYLEKCRDRLYSEFVLGGVAVSEEEDGSPTVRYRSGLDLLRKTPAFVESVTEDRLNGQFQGAYRYFESWFDGEDPYMASVRKNLDFLQRILERDEWPLLRRSPPCFTSRHRTLDLTEEEVARRLRKLHDGQ